jgi:heat shock protein HslJ
MRPGVVLLCTALGIAALTTGCQSSPAALQQAVTQPLLDTSWRLTLLGDEVVDNPAGAREVQIVLQSAGQRVVGFGGCNRLFGQYVLDGSALKIAGVGLTKMACNARMDIEGRLVETIGNVVRWEITGSTLRLLDATGKTLATFEADRSG